MKQILFLLIIFAFLYCPSAEAIECNSSFLFVRDKAGAEYTIASSPIGKDIREIDILGIKVDGSGGLLAQFDNKNRLRGINIDGKGKMNFLGADHKEYRSIKFVVTLANGRTKNCETKISPLIRKGDINGDGCIDFKDFILLSKQYGKQANNPSLPYAGSLVGLPPATEGDWFEASAAPDLNLNGTVDRQDAEILKGNIGTCR